MKFAKETWLILCIGVADLASTIVFIQHHGAVEANPLFRQYWEMGIPAFVCAKMAMLIAPLCILEWARKRNPQFVSLALRGGIFAYLSLYCLGVVRLNQIEAPHVHTMPGSAVLVHRPRAYHTPLPAMMQSSSEDFISPPVRELSLIVSH